MNSVAVVAVSSLFSGAVLSSFLAYIRDFRKSKAEGTVAERTITLTVDAQRLENIEKRLTLTQKSFDAERTILRATIGHLESELSQARSDIAEKDQKIAQLREEVNAMQVRLGKMALTLDSLEGRHDPPRKSS